MKNVTVTTRPSLGARPVQIAAGALVALVLFGGGFVAGTSRASSQPVAAPASASPAAGRGAGGAGGGQNARGLVNGQIISVNADSVTIQVRQPGQNGATATTSSQIVLIGGGTRVVRTSESDIKLTDLKVGDTITVAGTPDQSTGTVAATAVVVGASNILGDIFGGGGGAGGGGGGARPSGSPRPSPTR